MNGEGRRKSNGSSVDVTSAEESEDCSGVFDEEMVKKWSHARILAWHQRHSNPNAFYYRFTDPGVPQRSNDLNSEENDLFMERYFEFKDNGWRVGSSWGLFSKSIPGRVGYQCANYYRKLLKQRVLEDSNYTSTEEGNLKFAEGERQPRCELENTLNAVWQTERVKALERDVENWVRTYHPNVNPTRGRSGVSSNTTIRRKRNTSKQRNSTATTQPRKNKRKTTPATMSTTTIAATTQTTITRRNMKEPGRNSQSSGKRRSREEEENSGDSDSDSDGGYEEQEEEEAEEEEEEDEVEAEEAEQVEAEQGQAEGDEKAD
eukprot:TRINITY_DN5727_c0_g1_i3.p1 TRINITY_DN5727_c0_g1~~TRINITY_DN5727_c0_g1_i3.p1  ORF type:complete len:318 (-),score=86.81 TRINITY_DN5727_c0_g1_i3:113-1066(-)